MAGRQKTAREVAADLVTGVTETRHSITDLIATGMLTDLAPPDRARAQRLAGLTLTHLARAETVLKRHLRKGPPPFVRAVLDLATVEMLETGQDAHGVVDDAVTLVRERGRKTEGFAGLTNAVLRKVAATDPDDWAALPPQQLPGWLRGRLMSAYGKAAVVAMEAAHARGAPIDLTPKDGDAAALAQRLGGADLGTGSVRLTGRVQVSELPGYDSGDWWVQDAAAALAAQAVRAAPGERVLDLCAAPGGKTLQLAASGASVTALDLSAPRMERVRENLARCRLGANLVVADALTWMTDDRFDAVLLDAPCSATGTIRRHPDLPFVRDTASVKSLTALQEQLIDRAVSLVRPGGRLVFATCSLLPDEGEHQAERARARHAKLSPDPAALELPGVDPVWTGKGGGLRLRPDYWAERGGMDGFYIAAFRVS